MNPTEIKTPENPGAVTVTPKREVKLVLDNSPIAYLLDTARFEHCYRIAQMMARASLIPKHLKGTDDAQTSANCFLVVNQAIRWELDPFAIAPETYEVGGKLGFQGKLVAAVVNARGGLSERLSYTFNDKVGDALEVTVSGKLRGEDVIRTVTVNVKEARTPNQMWTKDPQQKLCYTGATKWARRHCPEIMLGVLTDDDLDRAREEARFERSTQLLPDFSICQQAPAPPPVTPPTPAAKKKAVKAPIVDLPPATPREDLFQEAAGLEPLRASMKTANVTERQVVAFYNAEVRDEGGEGVRVLADLPQVVVSSLTKTLAENGDIAAQVRK